MSDLRTAAQQVLEALDEMEYESEMPATAALRAALEQPERDVPETDCGNMQVEWADIPKEFNDWWDADRLTQTNPFREDSPMYWAWEGWQARAALEQPEQAEPVAWLWEHQLEDLKHYRYRPDMRAWTTEGRIGSFEGLVPVFNHPPRREWRSLSEEERADILFPLTAAGASDMECARAIEAALRSKNHE
jgi:hypothetical protein